MEEKIDNSIALHQQTIYEIEEIKERIKISKTDNIRFRVETKHLYGYSEPFLSTDYHKLNISKYTMQLILDEAIKKEKEKIDKLIDMEIENRKQKGDKNARNKI